MGEGSLQEGIAGRGNLPHNPGDLSLILEPTRIKSISPFTPHTNEGTCAPKYILTNIRNNK